MLVSLGLVYYGLGNLGILQTTSGAAPGLWESLRTALTLNDLIGSAQSPFTGPVWDAAALVSSFLVFFWLAMFVALTASSAEREHQAYEAFFGPRPGPSGAPVAGPQAQPAGGVEVQPRQDTLGIVAAVVNPAGSDHGRETLTLHNYGSAPLNLAGWRVFDAQDRDARLPEGVIQPGESLVVTLDPRSIRLVNRGGSIRLVTPAGDVADLATYTGEEAAAAGRAIVFGPQVRVLSTTNPAGAPTHDAPPPGVRGSRSDPPADQAEGPRPGGAAGDDAW